MGESQLSKHYELSPSSLIVLIMGRASVLLCLFLVSTTMVSAAPSLQHSEHFEHVEIEAGDNVALQALNVVDRDIVQLSHLAHLAHLSHLSHALHNPLALAFVLGAKGFALKGILTLSLLTGNNNAPRGRRRRETGQQHYQAPRRF